MKGIYLIGAALALPALIAAAQTTTPTSSGSAPYIALIGSGGGTTATGTANNGNSTWYIDATRNLVVLCVQNAAPGTAPTFSCTAQTVQTVSR